MKNSKIWLGVAAAATVVAAASQARADRFATLDRPSAHSMVGADFGLGFIDPGPFDDDDLSLRVDVHGQYFLDSGAGFYGMLPFSRLFLDDFGTSTAMGNLEAGGFYVAPAGDFDFVLRGGLALPTADTNASGVFTNAVASSVRVTDLALAFPDTTWLRLSASPVLVTGDAFFRADIGVDVPVQTDVGADTMVRLNVAGGVDLEALALLGELALLFNTDDAQGFGGDDSLVSGALTARFHGQQVEPGLSLVIPINDALRDILDLGLVVSVQVRLD